MEVESDEELELLDEGMGHDRFQRMKKM